MLKIHLTTIVLMAAMFIAAGYQQKPTLYPGAVPATEGEKTGFESGEQYSVSTYITKDSYADVRAYYVNENGEPRREDVKDERVRSAFFSYERRMPDDIGVSIAKGQGRSRVPSEIFNSLHGLAVQGVIPESRVNGLIEKYGYLEYSYFLKEKDEEGEITSADDLIYRKYRDKLDGGEAGEQDREEIMERVQQLMAQGRIQEATDLAKRMSDDALAGAELAISPQAADMWEECLEELASNAYNVIITIYL